jgi:hypothetical protein
MGTQDIKIGGAVTYWSLGLWTELEKLKADFTTLGLEGFIPEPRTPSACLKDALDSCYPLTSQLIRPLKSKDGFVVVEETRGLDDNSYRTIITARVHPLTLQVNVSPYDYTVAQNVLEQFNKHLGLLRPAQVTGALVKYIESLGGTKLRLGGGLYWLADGQLDKWLLAASAVERAGLGKAHSVYLLRTVMDADAVRAVQDAVTAEIMAEAESMHKEVLGGDLGERALQHRQDAAMKLRKKVREYEEILGVGLESLRLSCDKLEDAAASAALLVSLAVGWQRTFGITCAALVRTRCAGATC